MARYALLLLCLIGLTAAAVPQTRNPTIYIQTHENLYMGIVEKEHQESVTKCKLRLTNNTEINLEQHPPNNKYYLASIYEKCRARIYNIDEKNSGTYSVLTYIKDKNGGNPFIANYNVKVRAKYEKKTAVPSESLFVYPDQIVSIRFNENFTNLKYCKLLDPTQKEYDLSGDASANIKKLGHCGFKMVVKKEYSGEWTLIADLNNSTAYYTPISLTLRDTKDLQPAPMNFSFKRGDEAYISLGNDHTAPKMCYLKDPHGVEYPMQSGPCSHDLGLATDYHKGVWKAYYGFEGMEKLVEQKINVDIYGEVPFNSSVTRSINGDINLLCQVRGRSLRYCSFVRPDGEILHMTIGVGNEKYEYFGNGRHSQEGFLITRGSVIDCGVTIHQPSIQDYGSWRCMVRFDNQKTIGTVLKVNPQTRSKVQSKSVAKADDVYVKIGESYKIKCTAEEVLSYCWLRSPNGTVYSVLHGDKPKGPALKYDGIGLELGDCTAHINEANYTQAGKWTCHMGITNGPEIETSLNVIVTDSHLMADREVVALNSQREAHLICRPLPQSNKVIEACRWVNPLGHGINVECDRRYCTETGTTHCKLSISLTNLYREDVGRWSCYAHFANNQDEEEVAHMNVIYHNGLGIASILSMAICTNAMIAIGIGIFFLYKRRLAALRDLEEKIILEKPSNFRIA